ncbi:thiol:disulfide interchange protein DsbA/DsbL [Massilia sp. Leaf139]|uniref:thiol:disulfide interchange protein DsbA/DsbL n=1 Tax=Massilia sp. Leaf139 TaxID=1736272 RepID=UPI0006FDBC59|nr:thiol:disulfide interchange protein DsbA/DsbL [Massilia sp. Leaf139]KQQ91999.1 disulfide bond formation protein DsbA [Massilia sp. Leaf139]
MQLVRRLLCTAALLTLSGVVAAAPVAPKEGVHYQVLPQKLDTPAGKQVEVIEFFAYSCPHCNVFEPLLAEWVKKQGANIAFKRVHVAAGQRALPQLRLFATLEALGLTEQYHTKVFAAMHQQGVRFADDEEVLGWVAKAGIDRARFTDAYRSIGVQSRLRRAAAMMSEYKVDHWPLVAIDGRFITSPSMANPEASHDHGAHAHSETEQQQVALQVMDALVARAKADKGADKK